MGTGLSAPFFPMNFRAAQFPLACSAVALLTQACVEYPPPQGYRYPPPQTPPPYAAPDNSPGPPQPPPTSPQPALAARPSSALDPLLAPIALYPDPLLALILPASTAPSDISQAAAYLVQYGDATRIDSQPWDPSVRALAHYPSVLSWMAENIAWTQALGSAFSASPAEVMDSVQSLRAQAIAAGTLLSTPQERVVYDDDLIDILPGQPDSIYVPVYDPQVVYSDEPYYGYAGPFINYGDPYPAGLWLTYSFDWHHHRVWQGGRDSWREHGGSNPQHFEGGNGPQGARPWRPGESGRRQVEPTKGTRPPTPHPMPGAPNPPPEHYKRPATQPQGMSAPSLAAAYAEPGRTPPQATPMARPRLAPEQFQSTASETHSPSSAGQPAGYAAHPLAPETHVQPSQGPQGTSTHAPAKPQPAGTAHTAPQRPAAPPPPAAPDPKGNQPEK